MIRFAAFALALSICLPAQKNFDFESGAEDGPLQGWFAPPSIKDFKAAWSASNCPQGKGCAELVPTVPAPSTFGNIMQSIDAAPYRGKRIRYRAAVSTNGKAHAQLWFRVDRMNGGVGFFENMQATPIRTQGQWSHFEINGFVNTDAKSIVLGVMAFNDKIRVDDASLTITGEMPVILTEGPRPLTPQGLRNLEAFARLYGIVRHFHPSDQAVNADWTRIGVEGVREVEAATDLPKTLLAIFAPVAPTLRVFNGEDAPALERTKTEWLIRLQHHGFGQPNQPGNAYKSERIPAQSLQDFKMDLGGGLTALVPLAVYKDESGTLPRAAKPASPLPASSYDAADRATRLAGVIMAWNVFQHFYPYFDVVKTDWAAQLPVTLKQAAIDPDDVKFQSTLRRMVAALKDGHGGVQGSATAPQAQAPISAAWIEGKYIVTLGNADVKAGDEIVAINGKFSGQRLAELEEEISSATPQWARFRSAVLALSADRGAKLTLTIRPYGVTETKEIAVICASPPRPSADARPSAVTTELKPGIWYVDLTRATDNVFTDLLPQLEKAKGIVFDLRGYPRVSPVWMAYLSKTALHSAQWHIPLIDRPGHMEFTRGGWPVEPKAPYLEAKKVFLTSGGAISYAETTMGIIENFKLGEIVGEATAGTNGNVNPFQLPGGFTIYWTGMKVLKHDGSQHHGVGIRPTIPVERTQAGVAAGRDEQLERAVAALN